MKLAISNIAWAPEQDGQVYQVMKEHGFSGLEIAPTRIFQDSPYDRLVEARKWTEGLKTRYGFTIPSMQSIWYGRQEKIFGSEKEREILLGYTKKAVDFAVVLGCRNLVFGCPRNRVIPDNADAQTAIRFFKEIGDYAFEKGTVIGLEANPPIYNTNYINDTTSALDLIKKVGSKGLLLNLDVGTMVQNGETVEELNSNIQYINHVHISEPYLKLIKERSLHRQLNDLLRAEEYEGYISIEMSKQEDIAEIERVAWYVKRIFETDECDL